MIDTRKSRFLAAIFLAGFLIGVHDGRIALWKDGSKTPWKVFPYSVSSLPEDGQNALRKGIRVEGTDELNRLLENFLS